MIEIETSLQFQDYKDGTYVLAFSAHWCAPCRMIQPVLEGLSEAGLKVLHVDIDVNDILAGQYGIRSVPTTHFVREGKILDTIVGAASKDKFQAAAEKLK